MAWRYVASGDNQAGFIGLLIYQSPEKDVEKRREPLKVRSDNPFEDTLANF